MFGYLRVFIMVSLISVVIIAIVVGFYLRSVSKNDLMSLAENHNNMLVSSYKQAVWKQTPYPNSGTLSSRNMAITEQKKSVFIAESKAFLQQLNVDYFTIYDGTGQAVYTHKGRPSNIREIIDHIRGLGAGTALSLLTFDAIDDASKATILKTFASLDRTTAPQFYVEIHHNITEPYKKVILQQWVASGSIIIVFLLLMWMLLQTSKRAEDIIARQHESNMELAAKAAVAEAENQQKSMFLANVSHELRTPLNAIIGFSDIIKHELVGEVKNDKYANYVNDIHSAGVHLLSLINDILDFTKLEAGKLEVDIHEVNLSKMVKNCLRLVSPRAEETGVELVDATPKDALILRTDNKKLKQILLNLLSNAVKFTPSGGQVRVSAWRNVQGESIGFEVTDSGIGMASKDISRAMSPFGQVDSKLSRRYEGTGLGLPLTKKFVELMGGTFKIESEEGTGTKVTVTLPQEYKGIGHISEEAA